MQPESYDNIFFCGGHFEHIIARGFVLDLFSENFVENFPKKGGTKKIAYTSALLIYDHKTLYYLILFFVGFFVDFFICIYMKPFGLKFNIRLP